MHAVPMEAANPILSHGYGNLIRKAFLCGHELRHCLFTSGWYHLVLITVPKDCGFRSYVTVHSSTFKTFPTHQFFAQSIVYSITNTAMLSLSHGRIIFFGDFLMAT